MTEYLVFQGFSKAGENPPSGWAQVGPEVVEARSARSAIALVLQSRQAEGQYVAVPARSWQPVTVKTETKTALRFS